MEQRIERVGVREGYDRWSATYDATPNPVVALDARVTLDRLAAKAGERVLDAGCGTGRNLARLVAAGARCTGIDFSEGMLGVARARFPELDLRQADLHAPLPFADASFDAVLCALIAEHLNELDPCLAECRRVLVPGGRLSFSVYHPRMAEAGKEANFEQDGVEYRLGAVRHSLDDYRAAFERAGWRDAQFEEHVGDEELARALPIARRYVGFPLLLTVLARR
ncbi:MAG: class I SAM-dependent methyltransferase [Planctomycetes bacterium]|nr:class I SAM-dependent methyltransferase [Planctomycetota bacterium]